MLLLLEINVKRARDDFTGSCKSVILYTNRALSQTRIRRYLLMGEREMHRVPNVELRYQFYSKHSVGFVACNISAAFFLFLERKKTFIYYLLSCSSNKEQLSAADESRHKSDDGFVENNLKATVIFDHG